jgi:hypothetical protein
VNGDGFVDVVEGSAFFGEILIALDDDLGTRSGGTSVFPSANANGEIDYEESADLQSVLEALPSQLPAGGLQLGTRTVIFHGVDSTEVTLPATVASLPGLSRHVTLPVGCGVIREID